MESTSLVYLPVLTQLTHLTLQTHVQQAMHESIIVPRSELHRYPLADMVNLLSLKLDRLSAASRTTDVDDMPCALPPNLTRLEMRNAFCDESAEDGGLAWWPHVRQCQHLRELDVVCPEGDSYAHPTLMIQAIAGHLTGLVQLCVRAEYLGSIAEKEDLEGVLDTMVEQAGVNQEQQVGPNRRAWWPAPPLALARKWDGYVHEAYVMVPPPNMGGLTSLQHLIIDEWWLVVSSERYWRALAGCSSLRSLKELHASVPPPAGVTFPHLTQLEVTTSTNPGDTVALLGAFPALRELKMRMVPTGVRNPRSRTKESAKITKESAKITKEVGILYDAGGLVGEKRDQAVLR
jgi:hypothetical protein